uniref:(northern house mosquito) hypothetical protein n=1 Tax=Culex pipiens TaxID=7175 RepID=A0A8D8LFE3_CULPI
MEPRKEFTLRIHFGVGSRKPKDAEIFQFFRKQGWTSNDLSAMYREDHSLYVRFKSAKGMGEAFSRLGPKTTFSYSDGTAADVTVADAGGVSKYVRIFGLPPEVEDDRIKEVLEKYGNVQQLNRERYGAETGFSIWSGVRGVFMEVIDAIPAQVRIQGLNARIYYEGLSDKCFVCGSKDHLKANCKYRGKVLENPTNSSKETSSFTSVLVECLTPSQPDKPLSGGSRVEDKQQVTPKLAYTNEGPPSYPSDKKPFRFEKGKLIIDEEFAKYWDDRDELILEKRAAAAKILQDKQRQDGRSE